MVRWCWVNFQCRGVLLIWIRVGQGPAALAVGAGGGCLDILTLVCHFYFPSPSLWETARNRLKYCLKEPLSPKQPTKPIFYIESILKNSFEIQSTLDISNSKFISDNLYFKVSFLSPDNLL